LGVLVALIGALTVVVVAPAGRVATASEYVALTSPRRLVDTRPGGATFDGRDAGVGLRPAGSTMVVQVADRAGVPAGASSVVLNVTAVAPLGPGHLTVHPTGTSRPNASNVNYYPAHTTANTVIAGVGTDGSVSVYTHAATHLVVDNAGRLPTDTYQALPVPLRLADTRPGALTSDGQQAGTGLVPSGGSLQLRVTGRAGVPTDASAVVLNVTAVAPLGAGHVTVHPTGTSRPNASNVNYYPAHTTANTVIAGVGAGGDSCVFTHATTHFVVDVAGYLAGPPPPPAGPTCPPLAYGSPRPLGSGATVSDINNAGIVVGTDYHGSAADSDAVWWPTLDGAPQLVPGVPGDARSSHAVAINDRNQVLVSTYSDVTGPDLLVVDLPSGNGVEFPGLGGVPGIEELDVSEVAAVGLNDRGEVVLNLLHDEHGALYAVAVWDTTTGLVETHPELTSDSYPSDINDLGHVVGEKAGVVSGEAFYWDRDTEIVHRLDRGGFPVAGATGVNDRGQVVGVVSDGRTQSPAVFWPHRDAAPTLVPGTTSWVADVNEAGLVLKKGSSPGVWDSLSGRWIEFPSAFGYSAHAINDVGQIVGLIGHEQPAIWRTI
jgi:hypothetical protein